MYVPFRIVLGLESFKVYFCHKVKMQYMHFTLNANYFFYFGRFLKKLLDDQLSSRTKACIYYIKHNMSIQVYIYNLFPRGWIDLKLQVLYGIFIHCIFTLNSSMGCLQIAWNSHFSTYNDPIKCNGPSQLPNQINCLRFDYSLPCIASV